MSTSSVLLLLVLLDTLQAPETTHPLPGKLMRLMQVLPMNGQSWLFHCLRADVEVSSGEYPKISAKSLPLARGKGSTFERAVGGSPVGGFVNCFDWQQAFYMLCHGSR